MLKRHIPAYRDKIETSVTVNAGVLVVPQAVLDATEWHKQNAGEKLPARDAIDALPGQTASQEADDKTVA
jgi:hypothetical protein